MSSESVDRLKLENEIARLTIERDRYHGALLDAKDRLWGLWRVARQDVDVKADQVYAIAKVVDDGWRFRQHGCPRCGTPCPFLFAMVEVGPHIRSWDCPRCGKIFAGDVPPVVPPTGEE